MNRELKNKTINTYRPKFIVLIVFVMFLFFGVGYSLVGAQATPYIDTSGDFGNTAWDATPDISTYKTSPNQTDTTAPPKAIVIDESGASNASANRSNTGATPSTAGQTRQAQSVGYCVGGQLLARLFTSAISSTIKDVGKSFVTDTAETVSKVPTTFGGTEAARNIESNTNAQTGTFIMGKQIGLGWDGVAWCIVNTVIDYIVNSTIQWANSGFKGNPAFIRNPEQFFKQLADREAASFIQELAYNKTGINVCAPFRVVIATGLTGSYNGLNNYARYNSCSLSQMQQNAMQSGKYTITTPTDWIALTKPQNNVYYSYISAGDELSKRVNVKRNTATFDLTINRGFLSYKKCKDDGKPESRTNPCDTITPGSVIADSLSQTLNIPRERLVSAQKFDQMVDAVVNNLIKIALSKALEEVTGKEASQANRSDYYTAVANYSTGYGTEYNNNGGYTGGGATVGNPSGGGGTLANNALLVSNPDGTYSMTTSRLALDTDGVDDPGVDPTTHQSQTSYGHGLSTYDNYVVTPCQSPVKMGTLVIITDPLRGVRTTAIVGDCGGSQGYGEVSIGVARTFNIYPGGDRINSITLQFDYTNKQATSIPKGPGR